MAFVHESFDVFQHSAVSTSAVPTEHECESVWCCAGASILAPAVLHLASLLELDVSYNRVRNDGMLDLMRGVAQLTGLHGLNLAGAKSILGFVYFWRFP